MGYISDHNKFIHTNTFDKEIVYILYQEIKDECIELVINGYNDYINDDKKIFVIDEETITAGLSGHIENRIDNEELHFEIVPELRQYSKDIKSGLIKPRKAKRLDLRITNFQLIPKRRFCIEAKLLAETNTFSKNANRLINEYVEDAGMGKFINQIYDKELFDDGFMLGYILNGSTDGIVDKINLKIAITYSTKEQLFKHKKHYISSYSFSGNLRELYHIFLDFSNL